MSSSNSPRLPSTPDMILRILQVLTENQRKLQETCDSLVATTEDIKQMLINHNTTPILRNGQGRVASNNQLDSSIMTLLEGIDDIRVQELINNPKILGVRDFNRPPEGTHKSRILEVITSNVNEYKKAYEAEVAAGGVRKEKEEHDAIMAVTPIVSEAYKNVGLITKLYVKNNILPFHPKDIKWDDLHSLEKGKHAAVLEDLLKRSKYPGVEMHNCKNSWAATSLFSECIRGITKNNNTAAASVTVTRPARTPVFATNSQVDQTEAQSLSQVSNDGWDSEINCADDSLELFGEFGSFISTQSSQGFSDLLRENISDSSAEKRQAVEKRKKDAEQANASSSKRIARYPSYMQQ